jgi:hypothetical protein
MAGPLAVRAHLAQARPVSRGRPEGRNASAAGAQGVQEHCDHRAGLTARERPQSPAPAAKPA